MPPRQLTHILQLRKQIADHTSKGPLILYNATLPPFDGNRTKSWVANIGILDGRIAFISDALKSDHPGPRIDLAGRMVWPRFADIHTHLDKGHVLYRTGLAGGTLDGAISVISADRAAHWNSDDLKLRMNFGLQSAYHYGSSLIRTHIDSQPGHFETSWDVFEEVRRNWEGRIALQGSSLVPITLLRDSEYAENLAHRVARAKGSFGAVTFPVPDLPMLLERAFALAAKYGLNVDFHADETGDPHSLALLDIAEVAKRYKGHVRAVAGHCCSLAIQTEEKVKRTLDAVATAGIGLISLPACNLYLQDRMGSDVTPRWRGLTAFKEARAMGIDVALASDNTRDPFHPFGDLDMLDTFRLGVRALHLDDPVDIWIDTVTTSASKMIGVETRPLQEGSAADFIIFDGRSFSEVLARSEANRIVIARGQPIESELPPYSMLDPIGLPN